MNLLKTIKSNQFALIVAILSVVVQSFHSYTAFYNTSSLQGSLWGIAQAVLFAAVIDMAILFYTVRGRKDIALYAAAAMVMINAYYYYQHLGLSFQFAFGVFLALIIPVSVYFYSEEIKDEDGVDWKQQHDNLTAAHNDLMEINEIYKKTAGIAQTENSTLIQRLDELKRVVKDRGDKILDLKNRLAVSDRGAIQTTGRAEYEKIPNVEDFIESDKVSEIEYEPEPGHMPIDKSILGVYPEAYALKKKAYSPINTNGAGSEVSE